MNCEICPYEERIKRLENQSDKNIEENKEMRESIFNIERTTLEMQGDMRLMSSSISSVMELVKTVQIDTKELKEKPYKRYDTFSVAAISSTIALVIKSAFDYIIKG